jgi:protein TonB
MRARPAFALSLLAALGIHALILLVPRAPFVGEAKVLPAVMIDLAETQTVMAMSAAAVPAPLPLRSVQAAAQTSPPQPAQQPAPAQEPEAETASSEPADPAPALLPGPQAEQDQEAPAAAETGSPALPVSAQGPGGNSAAGSDTAALSSPASAASGGSSNVPAIAGSELVAPRPRNPIQPAYPRAARQSGAEGLVKVTAMVDEGGAVTEVELLLSSGSATLDRAALDAVRRAAFTPALQGGKPVPCRITIPIRFKLSAAGS